MKFQLKSPEYTIRLFSFSENEQLTRVSEWLPRVLQRPNRPGTTRGRQLRRSPENSSIYKAKENWFSRNLADAAVTVHDILFYSKLNVLLIIVPLAITSYLIHTNR